MRPNVRSGTTVISAPVAVVRPSGATNVGPVRWLTCEYVTSSYWKPYLQLVPGQEVGALDLELTVPAVVALLVEADAAGGDVGRGGLIDDAPVVHRGGLLDLVPGVRKRRLEQERRRDHAVVADGLVVSAVGVELAERRGVGDLERSGPLRAQFPARRVAEQRHIEAVAVRELVGELERVVEVGPLPVHEAEIFEREPRRRLQLTRVERGIEGAEDEQAIGDDRTAGLDAEIGLLVLAELHGAVQALVSLRGRLQERRPRIAERGAAEPVAAALGDDVDHAPHRLPVLRLVAAGLHLHFLDEVERRGVAERAEDDRVAAQRAVPLIGDVHPVDDVLVVEAGAARDGRVGTADAAAAADAGGQIDRVAEAATDGHALQQIAGQHRAGGGGGGVHDHGGTTDFDGLGQAAHLHLDRELGCLTEADGHAPDLHDSEALNLGAHVVGARYEEGGLKTPFGVGHDRTRALRSGHGDGDAWNGESLRIAQPAAQRAGGLRRCHA